MTTPSFSPHFSTSRFTRWCLAWALVLCFSACTVYKPTYSQGNVLTAEAIGKLQVGMPKAQVQVLLGSPLLQDVFHANRWEYVYRQSKGDKTFEQRSFTVEFDTAGKLVKWSGDAPNISLSAPLPPTTNFTVAEPPAPPIQAAKTTQTAIQGAVSLSLPPTAETKALPEAANTASLDLTERAVARSVEKWRAAWEKSDFDAYVRSYHSDFTGAFSTRSAWLADRKRRVQNRNILSVSLVDVTVQHTAPGAARAYFVQNYRASNFKQKGEKTLLLAQIQGQWFIVSETFNRHMA